MVSKIEKASLKAPKKKTPKVIPTKRKAKLMTAIKSAEIEVKMERPESVHGCDDCDVYESQHMRPWEVVLNVFCPKIKRPRRTSLHTLATVIGHPDPIKLAEELKKSDKVVGYVCPDVKTPIFYLKSLAQKPGMIDTRNDKVWGDWGHLNAGARSLQEFVDNNPYPRIKGFKRFAENTWSGGSYGKGTMIPAKSAMEVPYEEGDYDYARLVIKALTEAGFTPGIKEENGKIVAVVGE